MAQYDFSPGFSIINNALARIGQGNEETWKRKSYADVGADLQSGNLSGAAQKAFALDPSVGISILKMAQEQQNLQKGSQEFRDAIGGGSLGGLMAPQAAGGGAPAAAPALPSMVTTDPASPAAASPAAAAAPAGGGTTLPRIAQMQGDPAVGLLKKFEGFAGKPYWDVNAYRVGYGSDTVTDPATGQVRRVTPGMAITREMADADLARRIPEFQRTIAQQFPGFAQLPDNVKAALTSVGYNYGRLPGSVVRALNTGDMQQVASAVRALPANSDRRRQEADFILAGAAPSSSAQSSGQPTQLGSTGGRGYTMPLPGAGVQVASADPAFAPQMPVPSDQPPAWSVQGRQQAAPAPSAPIQAAQPIQIAQANPQLSAQRQAAANRLAAAMASPYLSEGQRASLRLLYDRIVGADQRDLDMQSKQLGIAESTDKLYGPGRALELRGKELANKKAERDLEGEGATPLTEEERRAYGISTDQAAYKTRAGDIKFGPAGTKVQIDNAPKLEFERDKLRDKSAADFLGNMASNAPKVAQRNADLDILGRVISRAPTGGAAATRAFLDRVGATMGLTKGELASQQDAVNAIINRIAPSLREVGSGAQSDTELRGFLTSLPSLSALPEGNQLIFATLQRAANLDKARASIAARWQAGKMSAADARSAIAELDDKSIYASDKEKQIVDHILGGLPQGKTDATQQGWKIIGVE